MSSPANPFISVHSPMLFAALLDEYGSEVEYWPDRNSAQSYTLDVVWKEGAEDEETSPGRYSNIWIENSDLAAPAVKGDAVAKDGKIYDVVRIDTTAYGYSRLVLQENQNG